MRGVGMSVKTVRAPSNPVLIGAGIALLLLATIGVETVAANANYYRVPVMVLAESAIRDAILGTALVFVALRGSQFAGATAVIVATLLMLVVAMGVLDSVLFASFRLHWPSAIYLAIAAIILWNSVLPWSRSANKPVFLLMAWTFGAMALLLGTVVVLART
jgi:hypothetical protein